MTRDGRPHPFSRAMSRCDDVSAAMAAAEKAQRYEAFVSDVLRRDLRRVQEQRDGVFEQQAQVLQLRTSPYPASRRQLLRCTPRSTSAATSSSPQKYGPHNPPGPLWIFGISPGSHLGPQFLPWDPLQDP
ncbi:protein UXT isoform X3 [Falco peregrinus]|uniref:protein UXT isoform X3 n=1 Tax=Falco peregrinus TaxID=8954 RepID=UPI00247A2766|nr:protein UXT isoform X3 [Falco peregrinus]